MRKAVTLLIVLLLAGILAGSIHLGTAQASTGFKGIIGVNTTWTKANSPYNLTGNIAVEKGVTLTVEPGVTVNLNGYFIRVNGTLVARGTSNSRIHFNGGSITFTESSNAWNEQLDSGSIIENAVVNSWLSTGGASPKINQNSISGSMSVGGGSPIISKNSIAIVVGSDWLGRPSYRSVAISISNENTAIIIDNTIMGYLDQATISIGGGSPTIQRNLISNSYGYGGDAGYGQVGISISEDSSPVIKQNTIRSCANGISIYGSPKPVIVNNNFEDITNYNLRMYSRTVNIDVINNWWGTTEKAKIDSKIWDFNDDFDLGKVNYTPFMNAPNSQALPYPNAPVPTPFTSLTPSPTATSAPTQNPSATPSTFTGLAGLETPILLAIIAALLVIITVLLAKRRN